MKTAPGNTIVRRALLKWLMNAILVTGFLTFSRHVSAFTYQDVITVKTELVQASEHIYKRTIPYAKICTVSHSELLQVFPRSLIACLLRYESHVVAQLKSNNTRAVFEKRFYHFHTRRYSNDLSDEIDMNISKG